MAQQTGFIRINICSEDRKGEEQEITAVGMTDYETESIWFTKAVSY